MIILDTDHLSALEYRAAPSAFALQARMESLSPDEIATTAISVEEQMRGWLGLIRRYPGVHRQVPSYERLIRLFDFFAQWQILPFDQAAADQFTTLHYGGKEFVSARWILKSPRLSWCVGVRCCRGIAEILTKSPVSTWKIRYNRNSTINLIALTARSIGASVITLNRKDFEDIRQYRRFRLLCWQ
jgi:predicted nucleic acid-binding protein